MFVETQVWKEKPSSKWKWKDNDQGIFMQLDAYSVGGVSCTTERKVTANAHHFRALKWLISSGLYGAIMAPADILGFCLNTQLYVRWMMGL